MQIIILGSNGMLGSMLLFISKMLYQQYKVLGLDRSKFNVLEDDISRLSTYITDDINIIINCIGAIPQKKYSTEEYNILNSIFPHKLSSFCRSNNIKLIHISTNCVFSGIKSNYTESDIADATDIYGKSKKEGEPTYGLIIRSSIIGPEKVSYTGLMEWFLYNNINTINGFTDSIWNGLTTLELSHIIFYHIENNILDSNILHYFSENTVSKYELLNTISTIFNKPVTLNPVANGLKYYTLSSIYTKPRKNIYRQLEELEEIFNKYKSFYNLK